MEHSVIRIALSFVLAAAFCQHSQAAPSAEAFGRLPMIDNARLSPDGTKLAAIQEQQGKRVVAVYRLGSGGTPVIFNVTDAKVRAIRWGNNDRLLVWLSFTASPPDNQAKRQYEVFRIYSLSTSGGKGVYLFRAKRFLFVIDSPELLSILPHDPDHILIAQYDPNTINPGSSQTVVANIPRAPRGAMNVYRVDIESGHSKLIEKGNWKTEDWVIDGQARPRIRLDMNEKTERYRVYASPDGERHEEIAAFEEDIGTGRTILFDGFGADPNLAYVRARRDSDRTGVYLYDLQAAKITKPVFRHGRVDVGSPIIDRFTDKVIGFRLTDHMPGEHYFDERFARLHADLKKALPGKAVRIVSSSRSMQRHLIHVEAPGDPGGYYLLNAESQQLSPIGAHYPQLRPEVLGEVRPISYKARDGLTIPAYLTLPPGKAAKGLPLVVLPHGGPETRDDQSFDWWAQFYASRGYAVLQPNFRGSDGYGEKFRSAGYGEFGGKMQDDVTDGVKYVIAQGIVDPKRICIVGASYGGYAALAGAAFTPDLYACAVSVAGISDLTGHMGHVMKQTGYYKFAQPVQYWEQWLGGRVGNLDRMAAVSPFNHAARVKAAILLIHGKEDTIVPILQSEKMATALKQAGKPYRLIELEGEDHWLTQAYSRVRILRETEVFLKEHIGQ